MGAPRIINQSEVVVMRREQSTTTINPNPKSSDTHRQSNPPTPLTHPPPILLLNLNPCLASLMRHSTAHQIVHFSDCCSSKLIQAQTNLQPSNPRPGPHKSHSMETKPSEFYKTVATGLVVSICIYRKYASCVRGQVKMLYYSGRGTQSVCAEETT